MPHEEDPPRKFYTLKPKEIERLNPARGEAAKVTPPAPTDVKAHFARAAGPPPASVASAIPVTKAPAPTPAPLNDVQQLVQANAAKEHAAGLNDVGLDRPKKPSRKKRDYFFTVIVGNAFLIGFTLIAGLNVITMVFGLSGVILFNASAYWIIWHVMDDY